MKYLALAALLIATPAAAQQITVDQCQKWGDGALNAHIGHRNLLQALLGNAQGRIAELEKENAELKKKAEAPPAEKPAEKPAKKKPAPKDPEK